MDRENLAAFAFSLPETTESAHMGTRDFRVRGKIFLTFAAQDHCVIRLTPDQQKLTLEIAPKETLAVPGSWGHRGWTRVCYTVADNTLVEDMVRKSWRNVAPKGILKLVDA
jgi:hypothetical protein